MKSFFAGSILVLMFCVVSFAQSNETAPCPSISVTGPPGIPAPDEPVIFTVEIGKEAEKFNTILKWNVNNGETIEGQGTNQIKVLWKDMCGTNLTATVEVIGLPKDCQTTASETAAISCCFTQSIIVDEFTISVNQIDKDRLDNLAQESGKNQDAQIYIIERFEKNTSPKSIERKNQKIVDYLKTQGIERDRITLLNAFDEENLTKFILVPAGASSPTCEDCISVKPK
jgi:hypothetical protein